MKRAKVHATAMLIKGKQLRFEIFSGVIYESCLHFEILCRICIPESMLKFHRNIHSCGCIYFAFQDVSQHAIDIKEFLVLSTTKRHILEASLKELILAVDIRITCQHHKRHEYINLSGSHGS